MKILLAEDDKKVASFIKRGLEEQSYSVDITPDGQLAEEFARANEYDVIILDVMLPRKSGFSVCKSIRMFNTSVPILMLTALDSTDDKIQGFDTGADDYLVKPFEFRELLVRLRALMRRRTEHSQPSILQIADLTLDLHTMNVTRSGKVIELTSREFTLLKYLLFNRKRVVSRAEIAEHVWETNFDTESNVIDVYMSFLRKKIDKDFPNKLIHTVVGMGYIIKD